MIKFSYGRRMGACCVVLTALGIAACKSDSESADTPVAQTVTIIGTATSESKILTDVYARALETAGFRVARRADVADLAGGYAALNSGAADLFVTHTGELLTYLAANEPAAANTSTTAATTTTMIETTTALETTTSLASTTTTRPTATTGTTDDSDDSTATTDVTAADGTSTTVSPADSTTTTISTAGQASAISLNLQSNLISEILPDTLQLGAASNAEDKSVIACNATVSTGLSLLSDLAGVSADLRIAGTADFETGDPFGLPGFEKKYESTFGEFVEKPADEIAAAFAPPVADDTTSTTTAASTDESTDESTETTVAAPVETDADCGAFASSLDPTITQDMVVMDDDKNWIENNGVLPVLTATAFTPGVQQTIDQVSQALGTADLREMVRQVDAGGAPGTIAGQFLQLVGITGS